MRATYEDRYGLPLSAQGREGAEHYMEGIDRALALSVGAQASLEAAMSADRHAAVSLHLPKDQGPMMPGTVERQDALPR